MLSRGRAALLGLLVLLPLAPALLGRIIWSSDIAKVYHPAAAVIREAIETRGLARILWNPDIAGGFPLVADGAFGALNPVTWVLAALVLPVRVPTLTLVVGYLFAALALRAFARALGCSEQGAALASVTYAFSGFALGHVVHPNIVLGLGFLPLLSLVVHQAERRGPWATAARLGLLWGLACLTSHPQMAFFGLLVASLYGLTLAASRIRTVVVLSGSCILGLAVAAPFYLPMRELAQESVRTAGRLSYAEAIHYALSPVNLLTVISPHLFFEGAGARGTYCGPWNAEETGLYFGIVALVLALLALVRLPSAPHRFFAILGVVGLILGLGGATPAYRLVHSLPIIGGFRGPARWTVLTTFGVSVLAALAFDRLRSGLVPPRLTRILCGALCLAAAGAALLPLVAPQLRGSPVVLASSPPGIGSLHLVGRDGLPVVFLLLTALLLRFSIASSTPKRRVLASNLLLAVALLDLGLAAARSFEAHLTRTETLTEPPPALAAAQGLPGRLYIVDEGEPWRGASDVGLAHGASTFGGYFSLPLHRFVEYQKAFWLSDQTAAPLLDRAAVLTIADSWGRPLSPLASVDGVAFSPRSPIAVVEPGSPAPEFLVSDTREVALVSALLDSASLPEGTVVATLSLNERRLDIRAGIETAERVCDDPCAHGRPPIRHLAWSRVDGRSEGAFHLARLPLGSEAGVLRLLPVAGRLLVFGLETDGSPITPFNSTRYARLGAGVFTNPSGAPRARVAHRSAIARDAHHALVLASMLPATTVVLESGESLETPPSTVRFLRDEPLDVVLEASLPAEGYLVLADTAYPGWRATVDGIPAPILTADALFRAVRLPKGRHVVAFHYPAQPFRLGLLFCLVALLVSAVLVRLE